jgi:D-cysteine desulfhydrase family pyridoxal phosphate-dependent enzyme
MRAAVCQRLAELPRVRLLTARPPLERWDRLSETLGITLYVKREDLGGVGGGGNKLRKLELLLGEAREREATWLLTTGGPQSNHARLTAAAAARSDMGCTLLLRGNWQGPPAGNLLLARLFGADVKLLGDVDYADADLAMAEAAAALRQRGERPVIIPLGGATAVGTAAYVEAFAEIIDDTATVKKPVDIVVVAAGTGSTYAGLLLGARLFSPDTRVLGISVSWTKEKLEAEVRRLMTETAGLFGAKPTWREDDLWFDVDFIGPGYAKISPEGLAAVRLVARSEGVLLDTTYTGKAFAGLMGLAEKGVIRKGMTVTFVHSGGIPELYARSGAELLE